jgi:predicted esterase
MSRTARGKELRPPSRLALGAALAVLAAVPTLAQQGQLASDVELDWLRYELGRRMRAFERANAEAGAEARARALPQLESAVARFFQVDFQRAASAIDAARRALESAEASEDLARAWADGLALVPQRRCVEPGDGALDLVLDVFGDEPGPERPEGELRLRAELLHSDGTRCGELVAPIGELPATFRLEFQGLAEGDGALQCAIELDGRELSRSEQALSAVRDGVKRLSATFAVSTRTSASDLALEASSLRGLYSLARPVLEGHACETDLPVGRVIEEAEQMAASLERGERWLDASRTGEHWLRLPLESGVQHVRLLVPARASTDDMRPLVVALHGAGGSENLFFDGYGDGLAVRLAVERGWYFVAPRAGLLEAPDVAALVETLAQRLPVDRAKVLVIGHSLGADHGLQVLARGTPCAAAALLSGGWLAQATPAMQPVPFWLGAGERDFGLLPTRQLAESLRASGVERVELHEIPAVEHMTVVQVALPAVFAFFDSVLEAR